MERARNKRDALLVIAAVGEIILASVIGLGSAILEQLFPKHRRAIAVLTDVIAFFI